jgi:hypothetical protein
MYICLYTNIGCTHIRIIPLILTVGARSLLVFSFRRRPPYSPHPLNSRLCGLHIFCMVWRREKTLALAGNRTSAPRFTTFSPVTILIMLAQLPLLAISWFLQRNRTNAPRFTNFSPVTILIMLAQLPLLAITWFLQRNRTNAPLFTNFSPVTILIMLAQLPLLAISWFLQRKKRCM